MGEESWNRDTIAGEFMDAGRGVAVKRGVSTVTWLDIQRLKSRFCWGSRGRANMRAVTVRFYCMQLMPALAARLLAWKRIHNSLIVRAARDGTRQHLAGLNARDRRPFSHPPRFWSSVVRAEKKRLHHQREWRLDRWERWRSYCVQLFWVCVSAFVVRGLCPSAKTQLRTLMIKYNCRAMISPASFFPRRCQC